METEEIITVKKKKGIPSIKVSFTKDGDHYIYGTGQVDNYKFMATLEYQEYVKAEKTTLIEWKDVKTNKKYYSSLGLLNNICLGNCGEIQKSKNLQVKAKYTFVKIANAVLLTISKN
jgi:hypothetical protein